jgi:hypothetical protein
MCSPFVESVLVNGLLLKSVDGSPRFRSAYGPDGQRRSYLLAHPPFLPEPLLVAQLAAQDLACVSLG